jgi:uncharacterized tellurite resistance protein B-like protein
VAGGVREFIAKLLGVPEQPDGGDEEHALRLATVALMVEVVQADSVVTDAERQALVAETAGRFGIGADEASALIAKARDAAEGAPGIHPFTRRLNDGMSQEDKRHVVELLWRLALADGAKDTMEEHLVRRISDLLHLPHREFIEARLRVEGKL